MIHFTSNGIGRKNGFRFEIKYGMWLDGERQEDLFFLYVSKPDAKQQTNVGTYTERSHRFPTEEAAQAFCEKIVIGEVTIEQLKVAEEQAWEKHVADERAEAERKVDGFLDRLKDLGVDPIVFPDILKAYNSLDCGAHSKNGEVLFEKIDQLKAAQLQEKASSPITLGQYMEATQDDIDVCLLDKETGEHYLSAICYLSPEDISSGDYEYSDEEKWLMTLPCRIQIQDHCPLAVLSADFNYDETLFLLQERGYESLKFYNLGMRAECAGAEFQARFDYLTKGTPFELPFDGNTMDAESPLLREQLCKKIADNPHVFVATYADSPDCYAYSYEFDERGRFHVLWDDIDIKHTEPGQGLCSTLDGKVAWAKHHAAKEKFEFDQLNKTVPNKEPQEER